MATEIFNICDEIGILDRVIKDKPKTMKIHMITDQELNAVELKKWKLVLRFLILKAKFYLSSDIRDKTRKNDLTVVEFFEQFMPKDSPFIVNMIDPFLSGIWAGKISELSAKSTLHVMLTFLKDPRVSSFPKSKPRSKRVRRYIRNLKGASSFV